MTIALQLPAMPVVSCVTTLRMDSGILNDFPTNTWWFDDDDGTTLPAIESALTTFYNAVRPYYPTTMEQNGHTFTWYRQSDPQPRAPIRETTWNLSSAPNGASLPAEVAMCLSFQAPKLSGVPQARRRGRIYIGPLGGSIIDGAGRPTTGLVDGIRNAGATLAAASIASTTWKWAVFSRVNGTAAEVTSGWVDNAFDTQRRRGIAASSRNTF